MSLSCTWTVVCVSLCFSCLWNSVADRALSSTPVRSNHSQQLSSPRHTAKGRYTAARPSSADFLTSKSLGDITESSSTVDNPSLTFQPRGPSIEASSLAADVPEVLSRVHTTSDIVVEVGNDNDSKVPEIVHRRRRKKAKKNSLVSSDQQQQAFSTWEL